MIVFMGDIHGDFYVLHRWWERMSDDIKKDTTMIIQVGDFGRWPKGRDSQKWESETILNPMAPDQWQPLPVPVYFIDGNHEYFPELTPLKVVTEVDKNLFYIPRGTVLELEGRNYGFCGGAESIDKAYRVRDVSWFAAERITQQDIDPLIQHGEIDILITHAPPTSMIQRYFPPLNPVDWNLDLHWRDESAVMIEKLWKSLEYPPLICGHMHRSIHDKEFNFRILDINESFAVFPFEEEKK